MPNKYCNLDGSKKIKDEYKKINVGFDKVEEDVNNIDTRVNNIITTPAEGVSAQEIIDARKGKPTLGTKIDEIDNALAAHKAETEDELSAIESRKMDKNTNDISIYQINKNKGLIDETFISDSLKQQILGNTPIHSTPAKGSITKDKLTQRLISQEQTTFLQKGKNLFDKDNVLRGYFIEQSGNLIENPGYSVSDYIGIKPNTNYYRKFPSTIAFYDGAFNIISYEYEESGLITSPENAVYMRIALGNGYISSYQIEEGNIGTTKEDFYLTFNALKLKEQNFQNKIIPLESLKNLRIGKNKFNKLTVVNGRLDMETGMVDAALSGLTSDFIEIKPNTYYTRNSVGNFAFYDENKAFIPIPLGMSEGQYHSGMATILSPSNAKYIRIGIIEKWIDSLQFEEGTTSTSYEPFGYFIDGTLYEHEINNIKTEIKEIKTEKSNKTPIPAKVEPTIYMPGNFTHVIADIDKEGNIWAVAWQDLIRKSKDGINFKTVIDAKQFLDKENGETISMYGFLVADNGRIICATNKGRVLISDENQTTLTEAFRFENGYTQNTWGYEKKGRYILMGTYIVNKSAENQGREVYFSQDFGKTWTRIWNKNPIDIIDPNNYHIHDVAFDQYSDCILISVGDCANQNIFYSYDYGETFTPMFDESVYGIGNWAPIHPTSILVFPDGYAFGSDELPEGICWWNRPKGVEKPDIKWEDCEYKVTFNEDASIIGTMAVKGDAITTPTGIYGIVPFVNHNTETEGHTRIFATGDGGNTWHEIFKADEWSTDLKGFFNARLREEGDGIYIYATYAIAEFVYVWRSKMPTFI